MTTNTKNVDNPSLGGNERDSRIAACVNDELKNEKALAGCTFEVTVHEGMASVHGLVQNFPQKEQAIKLIAAVDGVEDVSDHITVGLPSDDRQDESEKPLVQRKREAAQQGGDA